MDQNEQNAVVSILVTIALQGIGFLLPPCQIFDMGVIFCMSLISGGFAMLFIFLIFKNWHQTEIAKLDLVYKKLLDIEKR